MKFGYFNDKDKEYVITTPETPLPWINYLGTENFFSLISNTGGGYSFYKDAKLRRLTRYRYNENEDLSGRLYYIKDGENVWSPCYLPAKRQLDGYLCRHGLGYTVFESSSKGIYSNLKCFVPVNANCEINVLTLLNNSGKDKKLSVYGCVEWCLWNAVDDSTNFQRNLNTGEVEADENTIYHKTEYRERRNHYAFYSVNRIHDGFDTDRKAFLGNFRTWENPKEVEKGESLNSIASGWSPIASHRLDFTLKDKEKQTFIFILGYCENENGKKFVSDDVINKESAKNIVTCYDSEEKAEQALDKVKEYWSERLSSLQVVTGDAKFDRMVNIWNRYQCMVTFNLSRSASFFESGTGRGMGFRDSCQDLLGGSIVIPLEKIRQRILNIAAVQLENGSAYHQYQPLTKTGNSDAGTGFNDDPLWLIACAAAYIKESGDYDVLNEPVPFENKTGTEKSLFEHLKRSVDYTLTHLGPHGLPLIGRADWNDCLNLNCFSETPGESFQTCVNFENGIAESVFIAGMFVKYGREYAEIALRIGNIAEHDRILAAVDKMAENTVKDGWDGEWFLRAYDSFGGKVGSKENKEGKIYIEPQGFCVITGIGGNEYGQKAMKSVKKYLLNDYGAEILYPPYTCYKKELGEISSYPPGYKENGAVFCHNNPWIVCALTVLNKRNEAFSLYKKYCPSYIEDKSEIHKTEPYVYSQMIAGRAAKNYGEAKNSWLTGTASWTMLSAVEAILGICGDYDGLKISPCLPDCINGYKAVRKFRGAVYEIEAVNVNAGKISIYADGIKIKGNVIPAVKGKTIKVRAEY